MKIIVPDFVLPQLEKNPCPLARACTYVAMDPEGTLAGDPQGAEVIMLPWKVPETTMQALLDLPTLKWIHLISAGVEHALDDRLRALPVVLTNARGIFDLPIAETVLAYILMIVKRLPDFLRQQAGHTWKKLPLREAAGLTVGLIGAGSIATEIARRCKAIGMHVIAIRRHPKKPASYVDRVFPGEQLETLLSMADFVVIAVPLTPETRGIIGAAQLQQMRPDAWLINIARGAVVDEEALIRALQQKQIAGAALDVFTTEPLPAESPLWEMEQVIITPHNSWSTPSLEEREAALFLENLERYLNGRPLRNIVDKTLGY